MNNKFVVLGVLICCCITFLISGIVAYFATKEAPSPPVALPEPQSTTRSKSAPSDAPPPPTPPLPPKTVRQRLEEVCPKDPKAGGMINVGNVATYDDYLFSGCTAANSCETLTPDPVSDAILNKKEGCGAWNLNSTGYYFTPGVKWRHF